MYSSQKGWWKICDFGIASDGETSKARATTLARGTPVYRAPELLAESPLYTKKADIWALGCIVFELCTGLRPFRNDSAVKEFRSPTNLSIDFDQGLSPSFQDVVVREWIYAMLQKSYQDRPSARNLDTSLRNLFKAMCPAVKNKPNQHLISKHNILGTDGPMPDRIIRWDDVFVPGSFEQVRARYHRYQRIHKTRIEMLGSDDRATHWSTARLAWASAFMGYVYDGEILFKKLISKASGLTDRGLLAMNYGLAICYQLQGELDSARQILEQVKVEHAEKFGEDDRDTLYIEAELAWLSYDSEAPSEDMCEILENILSRRTELFGAEDADTIISKSGLGYYFYDKKDFRSALQYFQPVLEARKHIFGTRHPKTVISMINVAECHYDMESPRTDLFEIAVEAAQKVLAPSHPDRVRAINMLKNLRNQ